MTIPYRITVGESLSAKQKKEIDDIVSKVFEKTHCIFNNWNPHSEISKLNQAKVGEKIILSEELKELLMLAQKVYTLSQGRFDPTVGKLSHAWKTGNLSAANYPIGMDKLKIVENTIWKEEEIDLDLGGIAKGHTVDLLVEALTKAGYNSLYVEWGGEIRTYGLHPEGRKWTIGIKGVGAVELDTSAIATSGNYEQMWMIENECYTHIIDPKTKKPLKVTSESIASATVVASSCALADAIATALMLFETPEEAVAWAGTLPDVKVWVAK